MATDQLNSTTNTEEDNEVDLCVVCCSKVKYSKDYLSQKSELLSSNLNIFYLLRKVLQLTDNELKKNLIGCGNPVEWIKLCDKCGELSGQAGELYRKLKKIERELSSIQKLIWDKTVLSINSEADRKLVEVTIDFTKTTSQVWRRIRNHVATKNNSTTKRSALVAEDPLVNPFEKGDKLANYLINQKASSALLLIDQDPMVHIEEEDHNILETNSSSLTPSSFEVKFEVTPQIDLEEEGGPQLFHSFHDENYKNRSIDNYLVNLEEIPVEINDGKDKDQESCHKEITDLEEVDALGGDPDEDVDFNWEPDEDDDHGESSEGEDNDESNKEEAKVEEYSEEKHNEKAGCTTRRSKVNLKRAPPVAKKSGSKYVKKGRNYKVVRTEDGKFKCRHCDQTFISLSGCHGHEREKHSKTPGAFVCDICGKAFNSRCYFRSHEKKSHKLKPDGTMTVKARKILRNEDGKYQCRYCDQTFEVSSSCSVHQREKHPKTPGAFICEICGRAFNSRAYLQSHKFCIHRLKHDGTPIPQKAPKLERDHICDQCGKGFKCKRQLKKHARFVHEKSFGVTCPLCGMGFPTRNSMRKHLLAKHPEDPSAKKLIEEEGLGLWICPVKGCRVRFLKESSVKAHLKSKHGKDDGEVEGLNLMEEVVLEDPSITETCDKCGKICRNKAALRQHALGHEVEGKEDSHFCETCGKGFRCKEYLNYHVKKVHLRIGVPKGKDFKCEICGKEYKYRYSLNFHLEVHEKEGKRDIFCDKCGHGFRTERHLRNHRKKICGKEGRVSRVYRWKDEVKGEENV